MSSAEARREDVGGELLHFVATLLFETWDASIQRAVMLVSKTTYASFRSRITTVCTTASDSGLCALPSLTNLRLSSEHHQGLELAPLAQLISLTSLDVHTRAVRDLSPLAGLTNLQSVSITCATATSLQPLSGLVRLDSLQMTAWAVPNLGPLSAVTSLRTLDLTMHDGDLYYSSPGPDFSPIGQLTWLKTLRLHCDALMDLGPLSRLGQLVMLDVRECNELEDVAALAHCTSLQVLYLSDTDIDEVGPLSTCTRLRSLDLGYTVVRELRPLASLTGLQCLRLGYTRVDNLAPLASMGQLEVLDLGKARVADVSPLKRLTSLRRLKLASTFVRELAPLAALTKLTALDLSYLRCRDLQPLTGMCQLELLNIKGTPLEDMQLTDLQALGMSRLRGLVRFTDSDDYILPKAIQGNTGM